MAAPGLLMIQAAQGEDIGPTVLDAWNALNNGATQYGGEIILPPGQYTSSHTVFPAFHYGESRVKISSRARSAIIHPAGTGWAGGFMWEIHAGAARIVDIEFANPEHKNARAVSFVGPSQTQDNALGGETKRCRFTDWIEGLRNENMGAFDFLRNGFVSCDDSYRSYNGGMILNAIGNRMMGGRGMWFEHAGWASEGRIITQNQMVLMDIGMEIRNGLGYQIFGNNIDANSGECIKIVGTAQSPCDDINISQAWLCGSGSHAVRIEGVCRDVSLSDVTAIGHNGAAVLVKGAGVVGTSIHDLRGKNNQADVFLSAARDTRISGSRLASACGFATANLGETGVVHDNHIRGVGFFDQTKINYHSNTAL